MADQTIMSNKAHGEPTKSTQQIEQSADRQADSTDRRTKLAADRTVLAAERTYAVRVRLVPSALWLR